MAGFGSKTPVSSLQEYLVSKKIIPHYDLVYNGVGTHNPEFTFRVQAGAFWEEGRGRSKQEAKQRAAEKMLRTLKVIDSETVIEEEKNESDKETFENFVGQLKDLCFSQHYPEPKYYLEEAGGPPHSRIFKMVCSVSQWHESGICRTKKQAKQKAAFKMIQHLKEVGGKKIEEALNNPESPSRFHSKSSSTVLTDMEVINKYNSVKVINIPVDGKDNAAFYKDHYKAYLGLQENSPTLTEVLNNSSTITVNKSVSLIEKIAKELGVTVSSGKIQSKKPDVEHIVMTLSITPPIGDVGSSKEDAALNLLQSLVCLCRE